MDQPSLQPGDDRRRLVFAVGDRRHEIDAGRVLEVVRAPHLTRVPNGPEALAGIANLRGRPIPVLSMSRMLDDGAMPARRDGKIILYDHSGIVGLLVDDVLRLSDDLSSTPLQGLGERLDAAFKVANRAPVERAKHESHETGEQALAVLVTLLSFRAAGQLYGIPLDHVREVTTLGSDVSTFPNAESAVVGLVSLRERTLPLVSLSSLLGLESAQPAKHGSHIVIVEHEGDLVGLVVDEIDAILRLPEHAVDAVPAVLQRGRGDSQIEAIGRIADSGRLISILSPDKLFTHRAVSQAISQNAGAKPMTTVAEERGKTEQFLIFQLGGESYGLPIASVDEVVRVPSEVTRVPGAPAYVMGVFNLRGKAIPLIDQRTRFDAPGTIALTKGRAIIVTLGALQAGFVVDGVSDVKAVSSSTLSDAPDFSTEQTDVFDRVAPIDADGRMVLLIDPRALLSRAEQDIVAAVTRDKSVVADP